MIVPLFLNATVKAKKVNICYEIEVRYQTAKLEIELDRFNRN